MLTTIDRIIIFLIVLGTMGIGYYFSKAIKDMNIMSKQLFNHRGKSNVKSSRY